MTSGIEGSAAEKLKIDKGRRQKIEVNRCISYWRMDEN